MTSSVLSLVERLKHKPEVLISGSAIGWYGLRGDEALTENDQYTDCFSHELCAAWEAAAHEISKTGVRTVILRIGIVLGPQGGALANMLTAFEFGGGGPMGQGQQWMSWIARDDLIRLIAYCISNPDMSGAVNATAPHPVRNKEFAKLLGQALRRPSFLPMPAFVLRWLLGEMGEELLLSGQKVISVKIEKHGFKFRYPELAAAFDAILGNDK